MNTLNGAYSPCVLFKNYSFFMFETRTNCHVQLTYMFCIYMLQLCVISQVNQNLKTTIIVHVLAFNEINFLGFTVFLTFFIDKKKCDIAPCSAKKITFSEQRKVNMNHACFRENYHTNNYNIYNCCSCQLSFQFNSLPFFGFIFCPFSLYLAQNSVFDIVKKEPSLLHII